MDDMLLLLKMVSAVMITVWPMTLMLPVPSAFRPDVSRARPFSALLLDMDVAEPFFEDSCSTTMSPTFSWLSVLWAPSIMIVVELVSYFTPLTVMLSRLVTTPEVVSLLAMALPDINAAMAAASTDFLSKIDFFFMGLNSSLANNGAVFNNYNIASSPNNSFLKRAGDPIYKKSKL
ncbi:hypothetical protein MNBD_GAMMA09-3493 [hydrothermal vent metagenome]|uniref:Uncharacterized protein n=1 Tax=hydrothermal vent metagenome TaxID=652676 RepID=A0A3B0XSX7_9ZZZZ